MTSALALADPVAALISWLRTHPTVLTEFGASDRITGVNEAPYPRLVVSPSAGGSDRNLRWLIEPEVSLVTYGALDGTPGQSALRRLHYIALAAAAELPSSAFEAEDPVVAMVRSSSAAQFAPEPLSGQPAWRSTLILTIHPPRQIS